MTPPSSYSEGPATDRHNSPVIDPTANVRELVIASDKRQDDMRDMQAKYIEQIALIREAHAHELRVAEAARIDAIRAVDKGAVDTANQASIQQAATLALQVTASADALRAQVEQTRIQFASTLSAALDPIQKDVADLRRVQYEQQGQRVAQSDALETTPMQRQLEELIRLQNIQIGHQEARTETKGTGQWAIGIFIAALLVIVSISVSLFLGLRGPTTKTVTVPAGTPAAAVTVTPSAK